MTTPEYRKKYLASEKGKAAVKRYTSSEKGLESGRNRRKRNHAKHREQDNKKFKEHYQDNKDYHKQKNKEHYQENKEKWKARRAEISQEWSYNRCTPSFVESVFNSLGASLKPDRDMTFAQCCSFIKMLGYDIEDVEYPPFKNRLKYFKNKKVDWL